MFFLLKQHKIGTSFFVPNDSLEDFSFVSFEVVQIVMSMTFSSEIQINQNKTVS